MKETHRYNKELADIEFLVDYNSAKASVYWIKRDQFLIKSGALLKKEPNYLKDGTLGFADRFALTLRQEHQDAIDNFVTNKDIILKSVNEVGHFLYFAGTNSWLILKDKDGKSINDYSL